MQRLKRSTIVFLAVCLLVLPLVLTAGHYLGDGASRDPYGFLLNISICVLYIAFFAAVTSWFDALDFTQIGVTSFIAATTATAVTAFIFVANHQYDELMSVGRLAPTLLIPSWLFGTLAVWLARRIPPLRRLIDTPTPDATP